MAYAGSGAARLRSAMSAFPGLTCTGGTGILPLCHTALTTWQTVDGRDGTRGSHRSVPRPARTLSTALVTTILARDGGGRWCEFTTAPQAAAQTFAQLYPQTRFLIVHRRADTMVRAILGASRLGPDRARIRAVRGGPPGKLPGGPGQGYWVTRTTQQLDFEQAHHQSCLRVRIEDLTANSAQTLRGISAFLDLDGDDLPPSFTDDDDRSRPAEGVAPPTGLPLDRIPPSLLERVNELHRSLDYPPVTAARV